MAVSTPIAVIRARAPLASLTLRQCRYAFALSQSSFAAELGVALETYRTWDSGRRLVRLEILTRARTLALRRDPQALLPLDTVALLINVHVRTLHECQGGAMFKLRNAKQRRISVDRTVPLS